MIDQIKLDSFDHIGVIVKNRELTVKSWTAKFNVQFLRMVDAGKGPVGLAYLKMNDTLFELLEPTAGIPSLWAEFLNTRGEGIHHICTRVPDVETAVTQLVAQGGKFLIGDRRGWAYVEMGGPGSVIMEFNRTMPPKPAATS